MTHREWGDRFEYAVQGIMPENWEDVSFNDNIVNGLINLDFARSHEMTPEFVAKVCCFAVNLSIDERIVD